MSDLISRQAAIDALHMHVMYRMGTDSNKKRLDDWINGLPSAQETHEERTETHACDLIDREAAIDVADAVWSVTGDKNVAKVWDQIKDLPSAQAEQRWIPCSERLPEEYGEFLVTMTEKAKAKDLGFDIDETYIRKMRYNSNGWQLPRHIPSWINEAVKDEVLAWMPLPELYQEEGEKDGKDT